MLDMNKQNHSTPSINDSEFSASSYRTQETAVSDVKLPASNYYAAYVQNIRNYKMGRPPEPESNGYSAVSAAPAAQDDDSDDDGSEYESDDDSDDDSDEGSDDEDQLLQLQFYNQWNQYYGYRNSVYNPYMNYMMNPMMYQMMMANQGQMPQGVGQMNMNQAGQVSQTVSLPPNTANGPVPPMNSDPLMGSLNGSMSRLNLAHERSRVASPTPRNASQLSFQEGRPPMSKSSSSYGLYSHGRSSELVRNSRRSTLKSKRYSSASAPVLSEVLQNERRVTSVDSNFKPAASQGTPDDDYQSFISDYNAFMEFDKENTAEPEENDVPRPLTRSLRRQEEMKIEEPLAKPTAAFQTPQRHDSVDSKASYDSIQSDASSKFQVASPHSNSRAQSKTSTASVFATPPPRAKNREQQTAPKTKSPSFSPGTPQAAKQKNTKRNSVSSENMPRNRDSQMMAGVPPFSPPFNPMMAGHAMMPEMMNTPPPVFYDQRQSMMFPQYPMMQSAKPPQPQNRVGDAITQKKINEFINLRKIIASGNKTYEYRLKWVKMLINSTNNRLYAFINIKGEPISPEHTMMNKGLFVKSSVQHISKLIQDLDNDRISTDVKAETCFIYANLLQHLYTKLYDLVFSIDKDVNEAARYYELAISYQPQHFKAIYYLGEMLTSEFDNEFDSGVSYIKQSAKLGYNKAIFKMATLYLNAPKIRSIKFLKIFHDLAIIDLGAIKLNEEDKEEFEEIIGAANYELGKIYEGIYPGDLNIDDDFIVKCLEIVPVNYSKALTYYNKSAKLNYMLAQVRLGRVYEYGELNRNMNANKSINWYMKAINSPMAFRRHPDAMLGLSRWCLKGSGNTNKLIPQPNPEKAVTWCDRAIKEFKTPESLYMMGTLAELGLSSKSPFYWYNKAASMGSPDAISKLNESA